MRKEWGGDILSFKVSRALKAILGAFNPGCAAH